MSNNLKRAGNILIVIGALILILVLIFRGFWDIILSAIINGTTNEGTKIVFGIFDLMCRISIYGMLVISIVLIIVGICMKIKTRRKNKDFNDRY